MFRSLRMESNTEAVVGSRVQIIDQRDTRLSSCNTSLGKGENKRRQNPASMFCELQTPSEQNKIDFCF